MVDAKALCAHFQLTLALLTGDIENRLALADTAAELQQQRGFANAGRAADQNQ